MSRIVSIRLLIINILIIAFFLTPIQTVFAKMPDGSLIANIPVANMDDKEVKKQLETEIAIWQGSDPIELKSDFEKIMIPRSVFEFKINDTITQFNEQTKRTLKTLFMRQKNVQIPLQVTIKENNQDIQALKERDYINYEATIKRLEELASQLDESTIQIKYDDPEAVPLDTMVENNVEIPELSQAVLSYAVDEMNGAIIYPDDYFSLLESVVFPEHLTKSNEELSFLGTVLYTMFLQTNFDIVERHSHLRLPAYAEPGLDTSINTETKKDLIVVNPNELAYKLVMKIEDGDIYSKLESAQTNTTYEYTVKNMEEIDQQTIYRYSNRLRPGEEKTIEAGHKGLTVDVYRAEYENDKLINSDYINKDVYLPEPTIVLTATKDVTEEQAQAESTVDPEELETESDESNDDSTTDIEIDDLDEELIDELIETNISSIVEKIEQLKETQANLKEELNNTNDLFESFYAEEYEQFQNKVSENMQEISESIERILNYLLNEEGDELDG